MNRIFHTRITWYQYFYLILIGALAFYLLWVKAIIFAAICMILLVFLIERFIHTTYTITADDKLIVSTGRFSKTRIINIPDIFSVEKRHSVKFGKYSLTDYILIGYNRGKYITVLPVKEREFRQLLASRMDYNIPK